MRRDLSGYLCRDLHGHRVTVALVLVSVMSSANVARAGAQRAIALSAQHFDELRALLTPAQRTILEPRLIAWRARLRAEGYRAVRPVPPRVPLAFEGVTVIDVTDGRLLPGQTVVVDGRR